MALACASTAHASEVTGDLLQDGIELYKAKRFEDAAKLFGERIQSNKDDAAAYYYLGNCCAALGKLDAANQNYEECLKHKPAADIAKFATQMRAELAKRVDTTSGAADPTATVTTKSAVELQLQDKAQAVKKRTRERLMEETNSKIASLQAQIDHIRSEADEHSLFDQMYFRNGARFVTAEQVYIRNNTQSRINELQAKIDFLRRDLRNRISAEEAQIDRTYSELQGQARGTTGSVKPVITSRSMYVRDYVHFTGDEAPPSFDVTPMKAGPAGKYAK